MQDGDQLCGISAAGRRIRKEASKDSRSQTGAVGSTARAFPGQADHCPWRRQFRQQGEGRPWGSAILQLGDLWRVIFQML